MKKTLIFALVLSSQPALAINNIEEAELEYHAEKLFEQFHNLNQQSPSIKLDLLQAQEVLDNLRDICSEHKTLRTCHKLKLLETTLINEPSVR